MLANIKISNYKKQNMSEVYEGVKFQYIEIQKTAPEHVLLNELKHWCSVFNDYNLAPPYPGGSSGNLSIRIKPGSDQFIITCSHTSLNENMADSDFSEINECNLNENLICAKGFRAPSSESFMHYLIYKKRPDINAIFHGHSDEIMQHTGNLNIPQTEVELPYGTGELAELASDLLKNNNLAVLKNHGFISIGKTPEEAGKNLINILNQINNEN